jgi:carboxymethylenebutenolidase
MADSAALLAFVDADTAARGGLIGAVGYCLSGQYAINVAARYPERVAAVASIYGTSLVTDQPDSPHVQALCTPAELYFACAEVDPWMPLEAVDTLRSAVIERTANTEVELYEGCQHGFAFPSRHAYSRTGADRHWERLFALLQRNLR